MMRFCTMVLVLGICAMPLILVGCGEDKPAQPAAPATPAATGTGGGH